MSSITWQSPAVFMLLYYTTFWLFSQISNMVSKNYYSTNKTDAPTYVGASSRSKESGAGIVSLSVYVAREARCRRINLWVWFCASSPPPYQRWMHKLVFSPFSLLSPILGLAFPLIIPLFYLLVNFCLTYSYVIMPVATAAFKLSVLPSIGIFIFLSAISNTSFDIPFASFPIIMTFFL